MNKLMTVLAATLAFAAFAECPSEPCPKRPPMMMGAGASDPLIRAVMNPKVAEKIGLSAEQKEALKAAQPVRGANRELQAKVRAGTSRQVELLKAEKIDEAAVMAAIDEVFEARKEMAKEQTRRMIAVRSILTPEQVSKALESMRDVCGRGPSPKCQKDGAKECGRKGKGAGRHCKGPKGGGACEGAPCEGGACKPGPKPGM